MSLRCVQLTAAFEKAQRQWMVSNDLVEDATPEEEALIQEGRSLYEFLDEELATIGFPVSYQNKEDMDVDIVTFAYLAEDNTIQFLTKTF